LRSAAFSTVTFIADLADFWEINTGGFTGSFKMPDGGSVRQGEPALTGAFWPYGPQNSPS
jgi:hypothetical protein